jgi:hypothetical protein
MAINSVIIKGCVLLGLKKFNDMIDGKETNVKTIDAAMFAALPQRLIKAGEV